MCYEFDTDYYFMYEYTVTGSNSLFFTGFVSFGDKGEGTTIGDG